MARKVKLKTNLGDIRPHTLHVFDEIAERWEIWYAWGDGYSGEHKEGRALDFMTLTADQRAYRPQVGEEIAEYLWRNRRRLGVWYVIWDRQIISMTRESSGWITYTGRNPHVDHVHVSFYNGVTYKPPAPKPKPEPSGEDVRYVVKAGDTVSAIAERYDTTVSAIVARNSLTDADEIDVGEVLYIPHGKSAPKPKVSLRKVRKAARTDPERRQGGTTAGAERSVRLVESALRKEGLLATRWSSDGAFGSKTVEAYSRWQRRCGYTGRAADGIPGRASLAVLGKKYGFKVGL